jgi:DNA-binding transcriptional MerR regulator
MTQWYVKDLSKLTHVSVQTLHHYDRIGLLKPSLRLANGYRLYSEKDLLKLQQIIALKFFGFQLKEIKSLLRGEAKMLSHFAKQAQFLEQRAYLLMEANQTLKRIISDVNDDQSIPWKTILKGIEVYKMTEQLENTWVRTFLSPEEVKQYATFEAELKTNFTPAQKKNFEETWDHLVSQVKSNLQQDPKSEAGRTIAKQVMDLINGIYGTEHANLKKSIWEKGFKQGKMEDDQYIEPEVVEWLDKAMDAYYRARIYQILDQVTENSPPHLEQKWQELMTEMYGHFESPKQELIAVAQKEDRVSQIAKQWLQQFIKA